MTREEIIEAVLNDVHPLGPLGSWGDPERRMYQYRGRKILTGVLEDLQILIALYLTRPSLPEIPRDLQMDTPWGVSRWIYCWILLRPEMVQAAIAPYIDSPSNWNRILELCRDISHEAVFPWIDTIYQSAEANELLSAELNDLMESTHQWVDQDIHSNGYRQDRDADTRLLRSGV